MKSFFDRFKNRIANTRNKMRAYWNREMNHSNRTKTSEGTQEIKRLITSSHKDQWRRNTKKSE